MAELAYFTLVARMQSWRDSPESRRTPGAQ
jgi:hypothetical protein